MILFDAGELADVFWLWLCPNCRTPSQFLWLLCYQPCFAFLFILKPRCFKVSRLSFPVNTCVLPFSLVRSVCLARTYSKTYAFICVSDRFSILCPKFSRIILAMTPKLALFWALTTLPVENLRGYAPSHSHNKPLKSNRRILPT